MNWKLIIAVCELHAIDTHDNALLLLRRKKWVDVKDERVFNVCKKQHGMTFAFWDFSELTGPIWKWSFGIAEVFCDHVSDTADLFSAAFVLGGFVNLDDSAQHNYVSLSHFY